MTRSVWFTEIMYFISRIIPKLLEDLLVLAGKHWYKN